MSFDLRMHPDVEAWRPSPQDLAKLHRYFGSLDGVLVSIWPRELQDRVLGRKMPAYSFRAFSRGRESHLFADASETPESIAWLMAHELGHQLLKKAPVVKEAMADATVEGEFHPASDEFHRVDPEERFVDGLATRLIGQRLDRDWWRERAGEPETTYGALVVEHGERAC